MGKRVSFDIDKDVVERPAHRTTLALRQTTEENIVPTESKSAKGPLVELEDKAIVTDKVESTRVENGKVDKVQIGNDRVKRDRVNPTATPQVRGQAEVSQLRQLVPPNMGRMTKHRYHSFI